MKLFRKLTGQLTDFPNRFRAERVKIFSSKCIAGSKVIDIGAGSAPYRKFFSHCEYKTADFCQLSEAQLLGKRGYSHVDFVCDISNLPVQSGAFDYALCTEVLEHVPNPNLVLREVARVVKKGGFCLISAPLANGIHQEPYHYFGGFSRYWWQEVACDAGFELVSCESVGSFPHFLTAEVIRYFRILLGRDPESFWLGNARRFLISRYILATIAAPIGLSFIAIVWLSSYLVSDQRYTIGYVATLRVV